MKKSATLDDLWEILIWLTDIEAVEFIDDDVSYIDHPEISIQEGNACSHSIKVPMKWVEVFRQAKATRKWDWQGREL